MRASDYKKQILEILQAAFPDGLPVGASVINLQIGEHKYKLYFDVADYTQHRKATPCKVKLEQLLNARDMEFLKTARISVQDVEEPQPE